MVYNRYDSYLFKRLLCPIILIIIIQIFVTSTLCVTDLDYSLRKLKNSEGRISGQESFHGTNSAELLINSKDSYSRIYVDLDQPLPLEDLESLSLWVNPQSGNASIQIDIYLDGDGDSSYSSKSSEDARIISQEKSWSELQMSRNEWNELDGFDLDYEIYKNKSSSAQSLDDLEEDLGSKKVVKVYITVTSNDEAATAASPTSVYIDYVKIGGEVISFEPLEDEEIKDGPSSASSGGLITYTITYGNNNLEPTDVIVKENYDSRTIFIDASPMPDSGSSDTWTFSDLPPGAHGKIVIKMRTIKPSATADIMGSVSGQGLTSTRGLLSNEFDGYMISNTVTIQAGDFNFSASASTWIKPIIGSTLEYSEHGSGDYQSEETLTYSTASIYASREISARASTAKINLSQSAANCSLGRGSIQASEDWSAALRAENDYRDITWSDRYWQAKSLNLSYTARLGKTLSSLDTSAQVQGLADRTAVWPMGTAETHLAGNFSLNGKIRWKNSNKSVSAEKEWLECCPVAQDESASNSTGL